MTLGLCLAATSLYFLFKPTVKVTQIQDNTFSAALVGSLYCFAGMTAILYPGSHWHDPEFSDAGQKYLFSGIVVAMCVILSPPLACLHVNDSTTGLTCCFFNRWLGYALEMKNLQSRYFTEKKAL